MKQKLLFLFGILAGALLVVLSPNLALAQTEPMAIIKMNADVVSITILVATVLMGLSSLILGLIKARQIARGDAGFEGLLHFILAPFMSIVILGTFNFIFGGQWNLGLTLSLVLNGAVFGNFLLILSGI